MPHAIMIVVAKADEQRQGPKYQALTVRSGPLQGQRSGEALSKLLETFQVGCRPWSLVDIGVDVILSSARVTLRQIAGPRR